MHKFLIPIFLIVSLSTFSCKENQPLPGETTLKYGTSFGFCIGYCNNTITLTENSIVFEKSSNQSNQEYPLITCTEGFNDWNSLTSKIDIDLFQAMDETIGCPDCADGGAEWIEINTGDKTHRVTFEYKNAPGAFFNYIEILRNKMQSLEENCE